MKSKISQAAKKSVSLLLAILMMFSMLTVGLTVTVNAADTKTIYFDNSKTKWDNVYITGNQWGWGESRTTMTPVDSNNKYGYYSYEGDISTEFVFRAQDSWNDNDKSTQTVNITTIEYGKVYVPSSKENDGKWKGSWQEYNSTPEPTPEPTPTKTYYYGFWRNDANPQHQYRTMNPNNGVYTYEVVKTSNEFQDMGDNRFSFKITNANVSGDNASMNSSATCVNYNIGTDKIKFKGKLENKYSVEFEKPNGGTNYYNLLLSQAAFSEDTSTNKTLVIVYKPADAPGVSANDTIEIWTKDEYDPSQGSTSGLKLSQTTANLVPGDTVTLTATHKDGCTNAVTFESDKTDVATVTDAGLVTAVANGTAKITATCENCGSATCTVTVSTVSFAVSNRIYAYANASTTGIQSNAWVCSEDADAAKLNTHNKNGSQPVAQPKLGSTLASHLRIFLPATVGDSVLLYNSFSEAVTINGVTIPSNDCEVVPFTSGQSYEFGNGKTLTLYKSAADGALYLNNTGKYAGVSDDGTVTMVNHLFTATDKDASELEIDNSGAIADKSGKVQNVAVKKIKGRGNTTWRDANKKSFNVNFKDNLTGQFNSEFTGKKYSLLANFKDPSLSRNKILYQLAKDMGIPYVPATATVDVYMNGLYLGSYLMCQKVEVGKNELINNLGKTLLEDLYTDEATGKVPVESAGDIETKGFSFLMELDSNAGQGDFYIQVGEQKITIKEPEYLDKEGNIPTDAVTTAAKTFVENKYKELINALNDTTKTYAELNAIVDVESLVKYFIVNEIAKNYDIGVSSTYFVYKRDVDANGTVLNTGKFYASPVWDMDVSVSNCKSTNDNFKKYTGNWTDNLNDGTINKFMAKVFANPAVQAYARQLWTDSYYAILTKSINDAHTNSVGVLGSLNNNYAKWNYPYEFNDWDNDYVEKLTSLNKASYVNGQYSVDNTATDYSDTANGPIDYIKDWLISRVAWLTNKYNTYYITGGVLADGWNDAKAMDNDGNGVNKYTINDLSAGTHQFKICTDGGLENDKEGSQIYRDWTATSISYNKDLKLESTSSKITALGITDSNNNITFTTSERMKVYVTYNQLTNTLTLSDKDTVSTTTPPSVSIDGSTLEEIKVGAKVTITATVTPVKISGAAKAGDYTVTLLRNGKSYATQTVTFSDSTLSVETSKIVTFTDVPLATENDVFTATVSATIDGVSYSADATKSVEYTNANARVNKIYFDPSGKVKENNNNWKKLINSSAVVTMTIDDKAFKMYIDSEETYALEKGVFTTKVDNATLESMKNPSTNITFSLGGLSVTKQGDPSVKDGSIYTYTDELEDGKNAWSDYNITPIVEYPFGAKTYEEFVEKLNANDTQRILYFDNSVSGWHNVYFYGWENAGGVTKNTKPMKKIPNTDVWYIDFDDPNTGTIEKAPDKNFLFKDRSGNAYGTDYQQTVDLVGTLNNNGTGDEFVRNAVGDGELVYLNFTATYYQNPNPIFITSTFYSCTTKGAKDNHGKEDNTILKYRAFNTEWKNYALVLKNEVKTKAVDIYFDLHDKAGVDSIMIYHDSTIPTNWDFATEFTRLNRIGDSTIYRGSIQLPYYSDNNELKRHFKFTKFVINGKAYEIDENSQVGQPSTEFINTGKIWFEINKNVDTETPATDYCNIIGYNTASANFSATNGGTVGNFNATITNGNYSDISLDTGFTEVQPDGSVTLYYALVSGENAPVVKFTATTAHDNEGTGVDQFSFDGWKKDGTLIADTDIVNNKTVADTIKTVNTVKYVANWSQEQYVKFTFTYNYLDQDYKTAGMEYKPGATTNYSYEVTVMVSQDDADKSDRIKELYLKNQPKISSDYYTYSFDNVNVDISTGEHKASSTANATAKEYKLTVKDNDGNLLELENNTYFYQNPVELIDLIKTPLDQGKTIEWKNDGLVIGYGKSIKFRITNTNTVITYRVVDAPVDSARTVLHQPTYEFFIENNVEKVRFNFLVENEVEDLSKVELGVLFFFTDETGANPTVYQGGASIPENVLKNAVLSGAQGINKKVITYYNDKGEYIFDAKISNTEANRQKYLRVYSYIRYKEVLGEHTKNEVILSDISKPVLGSISKATLL